MNRRKFLNNSLKLGLICLFGNNQLFANKITDINDINEMNLDILDVYNKLNNIEKYIGYSNFNIVSFDDIIKISKFKYLNELTKKNINLIEQIYYQDPTTYGFTGKKIILELTKSINKNNIIKVENGHYLYTGESINLFNKLKKEVGNDLILTSGIRSVPKQFKLFLGKIIEENFSFQKASKVIAPPGYTYHFVSDFDIGKRDYGLKNFTADFQDTLEFKKLVDLGYTKNIRYDGNTDGVDYEPWHIKVT